MESPYFFKTFELVKSDTLWIHLGTTTTRALPHCCLAINDWLNGKVNWHYSSRLVSQQSCAIHFLKILWYSTDWTPQKIQQPLFIHVCHSEIGKRCYRIYPQEKPIWIINTFYNEAIDKNEGGKKKFVTV